MPAREKALAVVDPSETQMERLAALVCFGDEDSDGKGLTLSQASKVLGISIGTARNWWRTKFVQDIVRESLATLRNEAKLGAAKHRETAIDTLVKATQSPTFTPTQVNAAKALLSFGFGEKEAADTNVGIVVNVGTTLGDNAMELQQRRHSKQDAISDGEYRVLPVE